MKEFRYKYNRFLLNSKIFRVHRSNHHTLRCVASSLRTSLIPNLSTFQTLVREKVLLIQNPCEEYKQGESSPRILAYVYLSQIHY